MSHPLIHDQICKHIDTLLNWYHRKLAALPYPIYSSYDVRDAGYKIGIVDGNIFPAGFNNICPTDLEEAPTHFAEYIKTHYGEAVKNIIVVAEEHTQNSFYWENAYTIKKLLEEAGYQIRLTVPRLLTEPLLLNTASGKTVTVFSSFLESPGMADFKPDLIISNNDFSEAKEDWARTTSLPVNPPRELGWYQRKKSDFFNFYNQLAEEFCQLCELDPFLLQVKTEIFTDFDLQNDAKVQALADRIDAMISDLQREYSEKGVQQKPFVFVKNNAGTYGLAVIKVNSGDEFTSLNYKTRKKMKAAKGGRDVQEVVIQEGIPSIVKADGAIAEPVIYMVGQELAGGFFRAHNEKTDSESLNSPGAVYKRMCIADLAIRQNECPCENVYGWASKLALMAIAMEGQLMKVNYKNYSSHAGAQL